MQADLQEQLEETNKSWAADTQTLADVQRQLDEKEEKIIQTRNELEMAKTAARQFNSHARARIELSWLAACEKPLIGSYFSTASCFLPLCHY